MVGIRFFLSLLYANAYEFGLQNPQIEKLIIFSESSEKIEQIPSPKRPDTTEIRRARCCQSLADFGEKVQ